MQTLVSNRKRPSLSHLTKTLTGPVSYLFTSSRYQPADTVTATCVSKRPALSEEQLRKHAFGAISLQNAFPSSGDIIPGFIPLPASSPPSPKKELGCFLTSSAFTTAFPTPPLTPIMPAPAVRFSTDSRTSQKDHTPRVFSSSPVPLPSPSSSNSSIHSNPSLTNTSSSSTRSMPRPVRPELSLTEVFCGLGSPTRRGLCGRMEMVDFGCKPAVLPHPVPPKHKKMAGPEPIRPTISKKNL